MVQNEYEMYFEMQCYRAEINNWMRFKMYEKKLLTEQDALPRVRSTKFEGHLTSIFRQI